MDYKSFIIQTLETVTVIANNKFGHVSSSIKAYDYTQVVTEADLLIGKTIIQKVEKVFPKHNILDEEAGVIDKHAEYTWVIDPIDGTSNFAAKVPLYGIMLGLLFQDQPIAGGVSLPFFSEVYVAEKGKGTYCNGIQTFVTKESDLSRQLIAYGIDGNQQKPEETKKDTLLLAELVLRIRNMRSSNSVFDDAMVVKGNYGGCLNKETKIWDNVATHILIEEAGGIYTDFFGGAMDYANALQQPQKNFTFCAAAPQLHKQLQEIIHSISQV